jgi:hypothetical protein
VADDGIGWMMLLRAGLRAWCAVLEETPKPVAAAPLEGGKVGGCGEVSREVVQVLATLVLGHYGGGSECLGLANGPTRWTLST